MEPAIVRCAACGTRNRVPAASSGVAQCAKCHTALPWVTTADDHSFGEVVDAAAIPVLVDLWATWCGPCRTVSPALERLAREFAGRMKLVKVDVDASPQVARRFAVQGIPMLLVMRGGTVVAEQVGAAPEHVLRSWLDKALSASSPGATSRTNP
jgi:thioredoxin 2